MEKSPFIKHIPFLLKTGTFLDVNTKQFNIYLLSFKLFLYTFFIISTTSCLNDSERFKQDIVSVSHDILLISIFTLHEVFIIANKNQMCSLIEFLMEPFEEFEQNSVQSKIVRDYYREISLYGKIVDTYFVVVCLFWCSIPVMSMYWYDATNVGENECTALAIGWVWNLKSHWYNLLVNTLSLFVCLMICAVIVISFGTVMAFVMIKIKYKIRLLCTDLEDINRLLDLSEESLNSDSSSLKTVYWEEDELIHTASKAVESTDHDAGRPQNIARERDDVNLAFQMYYKEKIMRDRVKLYLADIVEQHVNIIRYVRLADETFRFPFLVNVQLGVITLALVIPELSLGEGLNTGDNIRRGLQVIGVMVLFGVLNHFGQILLDESESFRQLLHNCDWTDKPYSLRRGLLIMQIVATKPLRLTLGGIYTMSMETYGNICSACYSYTSLIQSLKTESVR